MQIPQVSQIQTSHFPLTTGGMESSAEIISVFLFSLHLQSMFQG